LRAIIAARAASRSTHPFDADRTASRADIPQQFARQRRQRGQCRGADFALGQLAVVLERLVRQAGQARAAPGARRGAAFERKRVEVGDAPLAPCRRGFVKGGLRLAAEVFEHGQSARSPAGSGQ
jgi:hypothetical protein